MKPSDEILKDAQALFSEKYGYEVSLDEAEEMLDNLTQFFKLLMEIDQKQKSDQGEDVKSPDCGA